MQLYLHEVLHEMQLMTSANMASLQYMSWRKVWPRGDSDTRIMLLLSPEMRDVHDRLCPLARPPSSACPSRRTNPSRWLATPREWPRQGRLPLSSPHSARRPMAHRGALSAQGCIAAQQGPHIWVWAGRGPRCVRQGTGGSQACTACDGQQPSRAAAARG